MDPPRPVGARDAIDDMSTGYRMREIIPGRLATKGFRLAFTLFQLAGRKRVFNIVPFSVSMIIGERRATGREGKTPRAKLPCLSRA